MAQREFTSCLFIYLPLPFLVERKTKIAAKNLEVLSPTPPSSEGEVRNPPPPPKEKKTVTTSIDFKG